MIGVGKPTTSQEPVCGPSLLPYISIEPQLPTQRTVFVSPGLNCRTYVESLHWEGESGDTAITRRVIARAIFFSSALSVSLVPS